MSNEEIITGDKNPNSFGSNGPVSAGSPSSDQKLQSQKTGEPVETQKDVVSKKDYDNVVKKVSEQGAELGKLRDYEVYVEKNRELLETLESNPELVDAILKGKIDSDLVTAINEGKVSVKEAEAITQAHEDVKKDLGKKEYENLSVEQISKLIEEKVESRVKDISQKVDDSAELSKFERNIEKFIQSHPDYKDYAEEIDQWMREKDSVDLETAYEVVKYRKESTNRKKEDDAKAAEAAKEIAANAGGGQGQKTSVIRGDQAEADKYIQGVPNPNMFFSRPK